MKSNDQPLSPEVYTAFAGFGEDELFVARQLSLGHEIPKIDTQLQVKVHRAVKKKSARELFADMCGKLNLNSLASEKAKLRGVVTSYSKFVDMCRASAGPVARRGRPTSKQNGKPQPGSNTPPEVPVDIIAHYK